MIHIGKFNTLVVLRQSDTELSLDGGEHGDIPLPREEAGGRCQVGDRIDVFVYTDGKGKLYATTRTPAAQVDEVAWLKVVAVSRAGAFLDWGLAKDLLVPFSEQRQNMVEGRHYLVRLFLDEDNRIAASAMLDDFIRDDAVYLKEGQRVELVVAEHTELGYKAVVDHQCWGVLYKNEVFRKLHKGQKLTGFVKKIRADKKVDLRLEGGGNSRQAESLTAGILARLEREGGEMAVGDKSPPQLIYQLFGVSKKVFKQAIGNLYKQRLITVGDDVIKLANKK